MGNCFGGEGNLKKEHVIVIQVGSATSVASSYFLLMFHSIMITVSSYQSPRGEAAGIS